ncbi:DNA repair protein RecO [Candidatus Microgenomates bacterium]|nr:DNA repair protein RecO [Candidatus Microgenomates bacterium]
MSSYKTVGIILARTNYGEADRIFTIITPTHGKLSAMAKSVRKPASKLGPHLELFGEIELMLAVGRNLDILTSARVLQGWVQLAGDYERLRRGFLICEMINKLTGQQTSAANYRLLKDSLAELNDGVDPVVVELAFKLQLLDQLGYRPNLEQCVKSHAEIEAGKRYFFSIEGGGLVEVAHAVAENPHITEDHIKLWRLLLEYRAGKLATVKGVVTAAAESLPIANDFYDYLFGKRFKSAEI